MLVLQSSKAHNARHRCSSPSRVHAATGTYTNIRANLHQLPVLTSTSFHYWLLFFDNYLRYFWIYLLW
jgi:hypothetical protein